MNTMFFIRTVVTTIIVFSWI